MPKSVADLLTEISKDVSCTFEPPKASAEKWDVLGKCQGVVEEQFSSLDFMKTLASYGVVRFPDPHYVVGESD